MQEEAPLLSGPFNDDSRRRLDWSVPASCRSRLVAAVVVALTTPMLLGAPAHAGPLFGFNEDWLADGHGIAASNAFHPTVQRLHLNWAFIEKNPGSYEWEPFDALYRDMVAQGAPPIALVMGTPCWINGDPACWTRNGLYRVPPEYDDAWESFVRAAVRRYPQLAALEVWNEPNLARFFNPLPVTERYVELLKRAHRASKAERPDLPVLGGSLASITTRGRRRWDGGFARTPPLKYPYVWFLRTMYRLGAADYMDGLAFHPYPNFAPYLKQKRLHRGVRRGFRQGIRRDIRKQIRMVRRMQRAYGARMPIWATETGVCTTGPSERRVSRREQAAALKGIYVTLHRLKVRAIITHRLWDIRMPGASRNSIENGCGLTDLQGRRKPAWSTLARLRE